MALTEGTFEFNLFLILTIILLIYKGILSIYLLSKVRERKQITGKYSLDFIFGMFLMMLCLFISRFLFLFYDFYFTKFNPATFHIEPNVILWRFAMDISMLGYFFILFTMDRKVLNFKFKGIFAYIVLAGMILIAFYPVSTPEDFIVLSTIGGLGLIAAFILPIIFFYIGIKTPGVRRYAFMIAFGIIFFAIGSALVIQSVIDPLRKAYGNDIQILIFALFFVGKISGLTLVSVGVVKFIS